MLTNMRRILQQRTAEVALIVAALAWPMVVAVHGEPRPMDALKALIVERLGWMPDTPAHRERIDI